METYLPFNEYIKEHEKHINKKFRNLILIDKGILNERALFKIEMYLSMSKDFHFKYKWFSDYDIDYFEKTNKLKVNPNKCTRVDLINKYSRKELFQLIKSDLKATIPSNELKYVCYKKKNDDGSHNYYYYFYNYKEIELFDMQLTIINI